MFENLKKDENIEAPKDVLGGAGLLGSDLYDATVDMAYMEKSTKGAQGVVLSFKLADGRFYRQTIYITDRNGNHIWQKDKRKGYMPGFVLFDELSVILTGKDASQLADPEMKTIKVYNFTARKEEAQEKEVLTAFLGQTVKLGIVEMKEDHYLDTNTWAEKNEIDKVFGKDGMTVSEQIAGMGASDFAEKWLEKRKGQVMDKRKASKAGNKYVYSGPANTPAGESPAGAPGTDQAAAPSLFAEDAE